MAESPADFPWEVASASRRPMGPTGATLLTRRERILVVARLTGRAFTVRRVAWWPTAWNLASAFRRVGQRAARAIGDDQRAEAARPIVHLVQLLSVRTMAVGRPGRVHRSFVRWRQTQAGPGSSGSRDRATRTRAVAHLPLVYPCFGVAALGSRSRGSLCAAVMPDRWGGAIAGGRARARCSRVWSCYSAECVTLVRVRTECGGRNRDRTHRMGSSPVDAQGHSCPAGR